MSATPDLLFVYGTLMRGLSLWRLLAERCEFVGSGTVKGRLLDLGHFPGAIPDESGSVHGEVYRLLDPVLLASLDREEGYRPSAPERSLYLRQPATVRLANGREVTAWVYWYNGPRNLAVPIPGGDYRRHLRDRVPLR